MAEKLRRTLKVQNSEGIHARAAIAIAGLLRRYQVTVNVRKQAEVVDGTEVLQLLLLGAKPGDLLVFEVTGEQAQEALDALERLFANDFEEAIQQEK
jgi:phosphotransferase system HPr (HPr) family protein